VWAVALRYARECVNITGAGMPRMASHERIPSTGMKKQERHPAARKAMPNACQRHSREAGILEAARAMKVAQREALAVRQQRQRSECIQRCVHW